MPWPFHPPSIDLVKPAASRDVIPPLVNGDHLTRDEFERRYDAMPGLKKAELIEGVVHMPSPVRHRPARRPAFFVWSAGCGSIGPVLPVCESGDNSSIRLDLGNMPQPDALLIIRPERGGRVRISEDDYIEGGPELVGEVSASTAVITWEPRVGVASRKIRPLYPLEDQSPMATVATLPRLGPVDNGRTMTLDEFLEAEVEEGYRYELREECSK